jgi:hypothetical protein
MVQKQEGGFSFEAGRRQSRDLFSEIFAALARFFSNKKSLSLSRAYIEQPE